ncbi:hypothetical protein HCJ58_00040 [Listeria sp. FSL L7-1509]|uniref:Uncharacterized protein n=1 Tax=Listeria immobilis TaxID=2713502 RepID=A0ABR6SUR2_9LIST|nr:hypothetical protein [Listeria immobilis]MBC1484159.1 hypothetical protein [Listeria immobilis]MBC1505378.1 hypothetical protein [Listeria immobilis]MBC1509190.1 hypothetical protein [Listeria immobilis]MBC6313613.1 hypothetical protein [Listeria immobilis]
MEQRNKAQSGDYSISSVGDGNAISIFNGSIPKTIKRSIVFDVCMLIAETELDYVDEYSIRENVDWNEKLEFNRVGIFVDIFENYSNGYTEVEKILRGYTKREVMVKKIHTIYLKKEKEREKLDKDSDFVLEEVFNQIKENICSVYFLSDSADTLIDEEVDEAIYLIMFYVFTKCKLLKKTIK